MDNFKKQILPMQGHNKRDLHWLYNSSTKGDSPHIFRYCDLNFWFGGTSYRSSEKLLLYIQISSVYLGDISERNSIPLETYLLRLISPMIENLSSSYLNTDKNVREKAQFEAQYAGEYMVRRSGLRYDKASGSYILRMNFNVPLVNALSVNAKSAIRAVRDILEHIDTALKEFDRDELKLYIRTYARQQEIRQYKFALIGSIFNIIQEVLLFLLLGMQALSRQISMGDFVLYINSISTYSNKLNGIIGSVIQVNTSGKYIDNFKQFMELDNKIITNGGEKLPKANRYDIKFENVSFHYPGHEHRTVLKDVTLELKSGLKYAFVGPNGAGKTTFVKLLLRLYDPASGKITINGVNIADINHFEYQENFGVVFQDFQSYAYTIEENIVLNAKNDPQKLNDAINEAGLREKIESLESGVHTNIQKIFDAQGIEFSGGEQQKLAIARCLYRQSNIFVLDEPSAALDPFTEKEIYESIMKLRRDSTVVFITHRLTSVKKADFIVYMEDGRILESGTHDELMALNERYSELYNTQAEQYK